MPVEIRSYRSIENSEWDALVTKIEGASFEYTEALLRYRYCSSPYSVENYSFVYILDGTPLAVAILFLEEYDGIRAFANNKDYLPAPLVTSELMFRRQDDILSQVFGIIEALANEHGVSKILFRVDPLTNCRFENRICNFNYLMKYGYQNTSINTQILDLSQDESVLWSDVRKGHKHAIKKGSKVYNTEIIYGSSITREQFEIYKNMHYRAAGRLTRPEETFWQMEGWIKNGNGALCTTYLNRTCVSTILVYIYNNTAYYASAAEEPNLEIDAPVGHFSQWQVMLFLKEQGVNYYEIGWQEFGEQSYSQPTAKDLSIASYKRGFGGETRTLFRGILLRGNK